MSDEPSLTKQLKDVASRPLTVRLIKGANKSFKVTGLYVDDTEAYCTNLTEALAAIANTFPELLDDHGAKDLARQFSADMAGTPDDKPVVFAENVTPLQRVRGAVGL